MKRSSDESIEQLMKHSRNCSKFLLKSEPDFQIQSLLDRDNHMGKWDGIRNYQARNIQREMKIGDLAFFLS